jgi:hypothetical protein
MCHHSICRLKIADWPIGAAIRLISCQTVVLQFIFPQSCKHNLVSKQIELATHIEKVQQCIGIGKIDAT